MSDILATFNHIKTIMGTYFKITIVKLCKYKRIKHLFLHSLLAWFIIVKYLSYWETILDYVTICFIHIIREKYLIIKYFLFLSKVWVPICSPTSGPTNINSDQACTCFQKTGSKWLAGGQLIFRLSCCILLLGLLKQNSTDCMA